MHDPSEHAFGRCRLARVLVSCLALVALAACGPADAPEPVAGDGETAGQAESGDGELDVVRWGFFRNYQPVYVGVELGFFEEFGVDVQLTGTFTSGPAIVQAAGTGELDAGHSALTGIINAVAAGVEVVGVADSQTEFEDAPLMQWFTVEGSGIEEPADLRGKVIGTNSLAGSFYYSALAYLESGGVDRDEVEFSTLPHHNQEQALRSGQIDVAGLIDPWSVAIQEEPGVQTLFRAVDVLGERQFSLVFFTREFVEQRPDVVRRFLQGYRKTIDYIAAEPEASSEVMAEALEMSSSVIVSHRYTEGANVIPEDVDYWIELMRDHGELQDDGRLTAADVATVEFNQ